MFIIIPIAIIAFVIIAVAASGAKSAAQNKKKEQAQKAMDLLDDKEEFKKFLSYDSSKSEDSVSRPQQYSTTTQRQAQTQTATYRSQPSSKQQMTEELRQRLNELKLKQAEKTNENSKNVVTSSHHDSHCDVSHPSSDKYRVEYVPTMNSIGGKSTEGCQDHYNTRFVKIDDVVENNLQLNELQKVIVYGEVFNQPAFKRQYRGKRF